MLATSQTYWGELSLNYSVFLHVDSTSAIQVTERRDSRNCRHVGVAYRAVEEATEKGTIVIDHIDGDDQLADILTNALPRVKHERLTKTILKL